MPRIYPNWGLVSRVTKVPVSRRAANFLAVEFWALQHGVQLQFDFEMLPLAFQICTRKHRLAAPLYGLPKT
jgi:hypothetical protein